MKVNNMCYSYSYRFVFVRTRFEYLSQSGALGGWGPVHVRRRHFWPDDWPFVNQSSIIDGLRIGRIADWTDCGLALPGGATAPPDPPAGGPAAPQTPRSRFWGATAPQTPGGGGCRVPRTPSAQGAAAPRTLCDSGGYRPQTPVGAAGGLGGGSPPEP